MSQTLDDQIEKSILDQRRIFFSTGVDQESVRVAIRKLWYLEISNPNTPITLIINSLGGMVDAGFALWDQIQMISSPVTTLITGVAASMGSVLSLSAAAGKRFATPKARIMMHQPSIPRLFQGQATDLKIQEQEILKMRYAIAKVYMAATGKSFEIIDKALDRDVWMTSEEALSFGLIDRIVTSYTEL